MEVPDHERLADALQKIVNATPWLLEVLAAVRATGLPQAYVAAGCIRNTVWDSRHGRTCSAPSGDIDVVYFDPSMFRTLRSACSAIACRSSVGT